MKHLVTYRNSIAKQDYGIITDYPMHLSYGVLEFIEEMATVHGVLVTSIVILYIKELDRV